MTDQGNRPTYRQSRFPYQPRRLASEIRTFLIDAVSRTGGHLGPNLGVVELTIALHRVFDSPRDRIIFDVGHQTYVHKLLTGRHDFTRLRQEGGLSGYPSRTESVHDIVENQHASTALGWADGFAKANHLQGRGSHVVAVIGDGALTGGMAWEALNNIAAAKDRPLVIVVNDNATPTSPPSAGSPTTWPHCGPPAVMSSPELGPHGAAEHPRRGAAAAGRVARCQEGPQGLRRPAGHVRGSGLKYLGPVDGHDTAAVETALRRARGFPGPVIVHCITEKGRGYSPAERADERFHQVKVIDPDTGLPISAAGKDWTSVFSEEMLRIGAERKDVVAIHAAMLRSTGLEAFAQRYPERAFDVGIAEQHASVSAAGMATAGLHPVVAVYATFLNRCFDQVLMDVALHRCGVTFVLDRAGVTGDDGASHNGIWDLAILQVVPDLRVAAPRDAEQLRAQLREAVAVNDAPTVVRYSKGMVGKAVPVIGRIGGMDVLRSSGEVAPGNGGASRSDVLIVSVGALAPTCLEVAGRLADQGISVTVVDPRWVKPVDNALPGLAARHRLVVTVEDGVRAGGVGAAITQALQDAETDVPVRNFGVPAQFLEHAPRNRVLARVGLNAADITQQITGIVCGLSEIQPMARPSA